MTIPKRFQPHIDAAYPHHVMTVGTVLADGYAQITPRGSIKVYDDTHISIWERGIGRTQDELRDGAPVTLFYGNLELVKEGLGFTRLYGHATIHRDGPVFERVWDDLIAPERKQDPDRKGFAVLVKIDRVEDLRGNLVKE